MHTSARSYAHTHIHQTVAGWLLLLSPGKNSWVTNTLRLPINIGIFFSAFSFRKTLERIFQVGKCSVQRKAWSFVRARASEQRDHVRAITVANALVSSLNPIVDREIVGWRWILPIHLIKASSQTHTHAHTNAETPVHERNI